MPGHPQRAKALHTVDAEARIVVAYYQRICRLSSSIGTTTGDFEGCPVGYRVRVRVQSVDPKRTEFTITVYSGP